MNASLTRACATVLACLTLSLLAAAKEQDRLTVRVDISAGAPRLLVNGRPVRARMFFGGPGSAPLKVEPAGHTVEFEFVAQEDAQGRGTLHFRFGHTAGDVFLDNIRVVDLATGEDLAPLADFEGGPDSFSREWATWPPGAANTVGKTTVEPSVGDAGTAGLHVELRKPPGGQWPDWHIYHLPNMVIASGKRYRVSFWVRAEPARDLTVALYRPGDPYVCLGAPPGPFDAQVRMAASAGVDFVSFPIEMPWPAPGRTSELENRGQSLRTDPERQPACAAPAALRLRPARMVAQGAPR